ncbi:hypothetical protein SISNIDRAFT_453463 [Sistotremastrum niveocremeum HHB9708]|uniref:Uncharacterized protein n=2 Tax=Sistotremastraceae TaxID=3402574 RepID=A0A164VWF4_9AGAM|nr:hypothetical protein SISNIDRAFT_453463 [Sistotremastrum niveocremeum HHB9708]KZT43196.1 hypothetical protein SISSUDRAFT_1040650 [Sistotremastrum suecicum HHB10207 ss-3]
MSSQSSFSSSRISSSSKDFAVALASLKSAGSTSAGQIRPPSCLPQSKMHDPTAPTAWDSSDYHHYGIIPGPFTPLHQMNM